MAKRAFPEKTAHLPSRSSFRFAFKEALTPDRVTEICAAEGFPLETATAEQLTLYLELLLQWNRRMNLVGARNWQEAMYDLVLDSFRLARFMETLSWPEAPAPESLVTWDLGAGAGLPGIPLRMLWQAGAYTLIEAREKRALFLGTVLSRIPLPQTSIFRGRAEVFLEGRLADCIVSRAFMPWPQVLELVTPSLAPQGRVIFLTRDPITPGSPWLVEAHHTYQGGKPGHQVQRHFVALSRNK